jgi:catechol 2,3-dioxygenase-like lactoylglutathione lyase family enzyme
MRVERISAVTLTVASMQNSVRFYRDVLGMEIIYGAKMDVFLRSGPRTLTPRFSI